MFVFTSALSGIKPLRDILHTYLIILSMYNSYFYDIYRHPYCVRARVISAHSVVCAAAPCFIFCLRVQR